MEEINIDKFTVKIIKTLDEIEIIRPIWEQMQNDEPSPSISADIDNYLSVVRAVGDGSQPYIILIMKDDTPKAMLIGRREKLSVKLQLGYKTLFSPRFDCITVVYRGIAGQPDKKTCSLIDGILSELLKKNSFDVVSFSYLRTDSVFYKQIYQNFNYILRSHFSAIETHWRMTIPKSISEFYASLSKKHRRHLRQYQNKLERDFGNKVKINLYSKPDEVAQAVKDASYISRNTYQHSLGVGFVETPWKQEILYNAALKDWFRGYIMYIEDEPAAYRFACQYGRTYFASGTGYAPKWRQYRIGTILFLRVIDSLCKEGTVDYYDFGFGDAEYKRHYSNIYWQETSVSIYAPRFYPIIVNAMQTCTSGLNAVLKYTANKTGLTNCVKRRWRSRLEAKASKTNIKTSNA